MPSFFPEGDAPLATDPSNKSLQKINSLLQAIETNTGGASGGGLTDAELRASPVPVDIGGTGTITITSGTVTVSNEVEVTNDTGNPIPVSGTVTSDIGNVSNLLGNDYPNLSALLNDGVVVVGSIETPVQVTGDVYTGLDPLTNTQLRQNPVEVDIVTQTASLEVAVKGVDGNTDNGGYLSVAVNNFPASFVVEADSISREPNTSNNHPARVVGIGYDDQAVSEEEPPYRAVGTSFPLPVQIPGSVTVNSPLDVNVDPYNIKQALNDSENDWNGKGIAVGTVVGDVWQPTTTTNPMPVSGSVSVSNFPGEASVYDNVDDLPLVPKVTLVGGSDNGIAYALKVSSVGRLSVDVNSVGSVSVSSCALPTGASTSALQSTGNTSLSNLDSNVGAKADSSATTDTGTFSFIALFKRLLSKIPSLTVSSTRLLVDGSGVTQPVSIASAISQKVQGWDIPIHDYRALGYTSGNLTSVTYKTGGASGTTVATLTLAYDGSGNLTSLTKT